MSPRNFYAGPGYWDIDARVSREFTVKERYKLSLVGEAFNLLNHTNILGVNTTQYSLSGTTLSTALSGATVVPDADHHQQWFGGRAAVAD